jgi:FkbM family methyltransferase
MNPNLRRTLRRLGKPALEFALPWAERVTGFHTARGDYLPTRLRILTRRYEVEEFSLMQKFLWTGQTIVDVGANVGYTTRFFARAVGTTGKVHAFEPNPIIFPLLKRNVAKFKQVSVSNLGLSSTNGEFPLFLAGNNHSVACFAESYPATHLAYRQNETMATVPARVVAGDEFFSREGIDQIDLIKIDVEGWELDVLSGLEKTIARSANPTILCEFNPAAQECAGHAPRELLDWLSDRQFALTYIAEGELRPLAPASFDPFTAEIAARSHITVFAARWPVRSDA